MKKKLLPRLCTIFIFAIMACTFFTQPTEAKAFRVIAMEDFSTLSPKITMEVRTQESILLKDGTMFPYGAVIKGNVYDVKNARKGKRSGTFKFQPTSYSYNGKVYQINNPNLYAKYAKELDKGQLALSAATTAGSIILNVPGLGQAVSFAKGVITDPEDHRLKSGAKQIYKDSPFSYIGRGQELDIKADDIFMLNFKLKDDDDDDDDNNSDNGDNQSSNKQETHSALIPVSPVEPVAPIKLEKPVVQEGIISVPTPPSMETIQPESSKDSEIPCNSVEPVAPVKPVEPVQPIVPKIKVNSAPFVAPGFEDAIKPVSAVTPSRATDPYAVLREVEGKKQ